MLLSRVPLAQKMPQKPIHCFGVTPVKKWITQRTEWKIKMNREPEKGKSRSENQFLDACNHAPVSQHNQQKPGRQQQYHRLMKCHGQTGKKSTNIHIRRTFIPVFIMITPC